MYVARGEFGEREGAARSLCSDSRGKNPWSGSTIQAVKARLGGEFLSDSRY